MQDDSNWGDLLREGNLSSAITSIKDQVRENPENADLRLILGHLLALDVQWESAEKQSKIYMQMSADAEKELLSVTLANLFACESERDRVFKGEDAPAIFGESLPWIAGIVELNALLAKGDCDAALKAQTETYEQISPVPARVDGKDVAWLGDSDWRLGPMIEAMIGGSYYWVPVHHIKKITISEPRSIRDLIWSPVNFQWITDGESPGFIPTRYPLLKESDDDVYKLARSTDWFEPADGIVLAKGQRVWSDGEQDFAMLDTRSIEFLQ